MSQLKLLLVGASGYIGGSILTSLVEANKDTHSFTIAALIRDASHADTLKKLGVEAFTFKGLDDTEYLEQISQDFDIVVNAASGWHAEAALAMIQGLAARKKKLGTEVHYLHISGTSNLTDRPHSVGYVETRTFSDEEDIYSYEKYRESFEVYPQRSNDIIVADAGDKLQVRTYVIMAPIVHGIGTGPWNKLTFILNPRVDAAIVYGDWAVVGDGKTVWSHVHVQDLAAFYVVLLNHIYSGNHGLAYGKKGIYFCESGQASHMQRTRDLADIGQRLGITASNTVTSIGLEEAAQRWTGGLVPLAEISSGANSRSSAVMARKLGWAPQHGTDWTVDLEESIVMYQKTASFKELWAKRRKPE